MSQVLQKSKTWKVFNYSINHKRYPKVFLENGKVRINNNVAEQLIRGFCIGKKKRVMIAIAAAKSSAITYSIAETTKVNTLKPYDYF